MEDPKAKLDVIHDNSSLQLRIGRAKTNIGTNGWEQMHLTSYWSRRLQ